MSLYKVLEGFKKSKEADWTRVATNFLEAERFNDKYLDAILDGKGSYSISAEKISKRFKELKGKSKSKMPFDSDYNEITNYMTKILGLNSTHITTGTEIQSKYNRNFENISQTAVSGINIIMGLTFLASSPITGPLGLFGAGSLLVGTSSIATIPGPQTYLKRKIAIKHLKKHAKELDNLITEAYQPKEEKVEPNRKIFADQLMK